MARSVKWVIYVSLLLFSASCAMALKITPGCASGALSYPNSTSPTICITVYNIGSSFIGCVPGGGTCGGGSGNNTYGYAYNTPTGWSKLSGNGFHGFSPSWTDPNGYTYANNPGPFSQDWLNATYPNTFNLGCSGNFCNGQLVSGCNGPQPGCSNPNGGSVNYSSPGADYGYYLTTTYSATGPVHDPCNTQNGSSPYPCSSTSVPSNAITMGFGSGHYLDHFALYLGSADCWNGITLVDSAGTYTTFPGSYLFQGEPYDSVTGAGVLQYPCTGSSPSTWTGVDRSSYVLLFTLVSGNTWKGIDFSSTTAAFEFDNLAWNQTSVTSMGVQLPSYLGTGSPVPTPELGTLPLVGTGLLALANLARRRLRS